MDHSRELNARYDLNWLTQADFIAAQRMPRYLPEARYLYCQISREQLNVNISTTSLPAYQTTILGL